MIERTTMPIISTTADLAEGLPRGLAGGAADALREALRLPTTAREFLLFLAALALLAGGLTMHVLLSAHLFEARVHLANLNLQLSRVEEANAELVWKIAEAGRLDAVQARALKLGYSYAPDRLYVAPPAPAQPPTAAAPVDALLAADAGAAPFAARLAAWERVVRTNWARAVDWARGFTGD